MALKPRKTMFIGVEFNLTKQSQMSKLKILINRLTRDNFTEVFQTIQNSCV